ncbi:MAG TPA: alpha-L-arabinofuranosidase C-terminal domain-containing protein [Verrucomicrobiae bacterium]
MVKLAEFAGASGLLALLVCILSPNTANSQAAGVGALSNAQFTSSRPLEGWELSVYGAEPEVRHAEGHSVTGGSLCIKAAGPSDAAAGQEITVTGNCWYRFAGWVRTTDLQPRTASVYGTLQVQKPGGRGILAAGPNHKGDTDWTEVGVFFKAPADGRVRVCLFFAGFGTGTGTAWFSDIKLDEIQPAAWPLRVTCEPAVSAEISRLQYGQFIEYLCNLVPAMWAEKLYDGSFEGLSPYKFEFIRETDFKEKPWYPSGAVNRAEYSLDRTTKVSGEASKKISVADGAPCTVGLSQDGIFVDRNKACEFKCWFKSEGLPGPVRVRLRQGVRVYCACEFRPAADWQKFSARLIPNARDVSATLTVEFSGPGTLWLDNASLIPVDNVGGWRPDVVEAGRALKPGIIRFGGSALDDPNLGQFEWKDTIGDPDHRRPFRAWGGLQPVGPGLEEIVQFCRAVGAEPLICVRINGRTPKDAAEEIEYFNGATNTPMGAWRARNGHPEPYEVKYWQIGNEQGGQEYEHRAPGFCQAMKAVDPNIRLMTSFPTPALVEAAAEYVDFVCPHHYSHDLAWMNNDLTAIAEMIRDRAPGRRIRIGVTEWNTTAGDAGPRRAMLWSLANALACSRYHNLLHRHCDSVALANRSNLANSFCSGIIQTDNHRLFKTPTYYAQQLYATLAGTQTLRINCEMPTDLEPDFSATVNADTRTVTLFAVNDSLEDVTRTLDFAAFGRHWKNASAWTLADSRNAGEPDVANSFDEPERMVARESHLDANSPRFNYCFPRLSLTALRFTYR